MGKQGLSDRAYLLELDDLRVTKIGMVDNLPPATRGPFMKGHQEHDAGP